MGSNECKSGPEDGGLGEEAPLFRYIVANAWETTFWDVEEDADYGSTSTLTQTAILKLRLCSASFTFPGMCNRILKT